jgi:ribonucleoside-diphosphate reductase subunit M1
MQNADRFDSEIIYDRDFDYDYFGFKVRVGTASLESKHTTVSAPLLSTSSNP